MTNDHVLSFFKCENRLERTDLKLNMRFYNPLVVAIETGKKSGASSQLDRFQIFSLLA
jgi:hypothetical protein